MPDQQQDPSELLVPSGGRNNVDPAEAHSPIRKTGCVARWQLQRPAVSETGFSIPMLARTVFRSSFLYGAGSFNVLRQRWLEI